MHPAAHNSRGTVSLVALCFVMVLGIVLGSYLAVCSRAMNLSNRSFQASLGQQLAEFGLEEGLRAFNKGDANNWTSSPTNVTSGAWTFDTTTKRATRTITFASGKLAQGATATVKIRLDNYDSNSLSAAWSSTATYRIDNLVSYTDGNWYRCIAPNSNQTPSVGSVYWMLEQGTIASSLNWSSGVGYVAGNMAIFNGAWYRCVSAHTSSAANKPPSGNWAAVPYLSADNDLHYTHNSILNYFGTWYRYDSSTGWDNNPTLSWWWQGASISYNVGDVVWNGGSWYRCKVAHVSSGTITTSSTTYWSTVQNLYAAAGTAGWVWSSSEKYNPGDVVYRSSNWYRCIHSCANQGPPNVLYWATSPLFSNAWDANRQYSQNDTVRYNGVWYLSLQNSSVAQNPSTATTYWIGANTTNTSYLWSASSTYSVGDYRCYGSAWYKCSAATTAGIAPNNTSYWASAWTNAAGVTTGTPVVYAEAIISLPGNPSSRTQLRAVINPAPLFPNAMGATDAISLGANGTVDSYDSITDPNAVTKTYSAIVASTYNAATAVTIFGTTLQGYVAAPSSSTSPYAPLASFGTTAVIKGTSTTPSPKADTTRISRSPYVPQFDALPSGGLSTNWSTTPKGVALTMASTITLGTAGATTPSRYNCASLTIDGTTVSNVVINGPVILYVQGNLVMGGATTNTLTINTTGSAEIHVGGNLNINQTSGGIVNLTKDPKKLILICDSTSNGTQNYSDGDNDFYGVIYLPNSTNADGFLVDNSSVQIYGALSAKKITYSGVDANLHYDTSLRYATFSGVDQPYTVTEWRILPVTELATMP